MIYGCGRERRTVQAAVGPDSYTWVESWYCNVTPGLRGIHLSPSEQKQEHSRSLVESVRVSDRVTIRSHLVVVNAQVHTTILRRKQSHWALLFFRLIRQQRKLMIVIVCVLDSWMVFSTSSNSYNLAAGPLYY
ncbi:hypothetical protein GUJ93_ZPchr0007g5739 [Zizania palustris]|uniref:Uncharacterized protein n=1 Tax=Zizania palustris TaxID=103762 RepID=A0A8J5SPP4_ZIZPA|nr:hypothetical protein GUJ93_ZPchr0007g5739 [Zizania palustris]